MSGENKGLVPHMPEKENQVIPTSFVNDVVKQLLVRGESKFDSFDADDEIHFITAEDYALAFQTTYHEAPNKKEAVDELAKSILEEFFVAFGDGDLLKPEDILSVMSALSFKFNEILRLSETPESLDFIEFVKAFHPHMRKLLDYCEGNPEGYVKLTMTLNPQAIKNELKRLGITPGDDLMDLSKDQAKQYLEYVREQEEKGTALLSDAIRKELEKF